MQTTTKQQIETLIRLAEGINNGIFKISDNDAQTLRDAADTLLALKAINWEAVLSVVNKSTVSGPDDVTEALSVRTTIDLMIETFKG